MQPVKIRNAKAARRLLKRQELIKRSTMILPHLFTLGNAFFGFCSLIFAARGEWISASYLVLIAALMDMLDGRIARLVGATSAIGTQLDSLSDAISFCLAPAFLAYVWHLKKMGPLGIIVSAVFFLAGLLRLARFNVIHAQSVNSILGLPSTIAGCFLVALLLNTELFFTSYIPALFLAFLMVALAFLMLSMIPFPTFKQKLVGRRHQWRLIFVAAGFALMAAFALRFALFLFFLGYILFALSAQVRNRFL